MFIWDHGGPKDHIREWLIKEVIENHKILNAIPNETNDEMEPRRSGKSAAQKARDLHLSAGT